MDDAKAAATPGMLVVKLRDHTGQHIIAISGQATPAWMHDRRHAGAPKRRIQCCE